MKVYSVEIASTGALDDGFIDPKTTQDYSDFNAEAGEVADYESKAKGWIRWRNLIEKLSEMRVINDVMDIEIPGASSLVAPTSIKFLLTYDGEPSVRLSDDSILYGEDAIKEMVSFVLTHDYDMLAMVWNPTVVKQGEKDLMPKGAEFKFVKAPKLFSGIAAKNAVTVKTFDVPNPTDASLKLSVTPPPPQSKVIINGVETTEYRGNIGDEITWSASADHFISQNGALELEQDTEINVELVEVPGTVIINPTPSDAIVKINNMERKSYTGRYGENVTWEVSKVGYKPKSGSLTITEDEVTIPVELEITRVSLTINPTPADAVVTINGKTQKTITVDYGTEVSYEVSKTGYVSKSGTVSAINTETITIELVKQKVTLTIAPTPEDAVVKINGIEQKTITVDYGTEVTYEVSKTGYVSKTATISVVNTETLSVSLSNEQVTITITIAPTPEDAMVKLNGVVQKSVTVDYGTEVTYEVSKTGYVSKSGNIIADETQTLPVELVKQQVTLTIVPTPEDATVKLNGVTQKSITVDYGTEVTYEVSKTGYVSKSGTETVTATKTLTVVLEVQKVTFAITPTPNDATVLINGTAQTSVSVDYGSEVSWEVSKIGYTTRNGTEVVNKDTTIAIELVIKQFTFTITPTPEDATVTINDVVQSSLTADYGTAITWSVAKNGFEAQNGSLTLTEDTTLPVTLVGSAAIKQVKTSTIYGNTTFVLYDNGELYGCGANGSGQQGNGTTNTVKTFTKLADGVKDVACSDSTTFYLTTTGELYGCGSNRYGQQGDGTTNNVLTFTKRADGVKDVVCSNNTTFYLTTTGELYGCGHNESGKQGDGTITDVKTFTKRADGVKDVVCSNNTTFYITTTGELYGCGVNGDGQQGDGTTNAVKTFTKRADNVEKIYTSFFSTFYLTTTGELYGCGNNEYSQQGDGTITDVKRFAKRADGVKDVVCSNNTTFYITTTGELYGCGYNIYGQQGNGTTNDVRTFTKRADNVEKIYVSDFTTFYLTTTGELYGCGYNGSGQQGNGMNGPVLTFTKLADGVKDASCSNNTTFYLTTTGELYGCGTNGDGQQGNGTTTEVKTFTKKVVK